MTGTKFATSAAILAGVLLALGFAALTRPVSAHDDAPHFAAGEPGDPKEPARMVEVTMLESGRKMLFSPDRLEIRRGEQIRFVLTNIGRHNHEFMLGTRAENAKHAVLMRKYPEMEHDDPNGTRLRPKEKSELVWRFTKAGQFEFACLIRGHYEAGMHGTIVVK